MYSYIQYRYMFGNMCLTFVFQFIENILMGQQPVFPARRRDVDILRWQIAETVLEASGGSQK